MSSEIDLKVMTYITLLEKSNEQLVYGLKLCVRLLRKLKSAVGDPTDWQEMLDMLEDSIEVAERIVAEKRLH